jgi:hypothetical protein
MTCSEISNPSAERPRHQHRRSIQKRHGTVVANEVVGRQPEVVDVETTVEVCHGPRCPAQVPYIGRDNGGRMLGWRLASAQT